MLLASCIINPSVNISVSQYIATMFPRLSLSAGASPPPGASIGQASGARSDRAAAAWYSYLRVAYINGAYLRSFVSISRERGGHLSAVLGRPQTQWRA